MKYLLLLSLCGYAICGHTQTYTADEAASLKTDNALEAISFSGKAKNLKTLYKKLPLFPNLTRIIIQPDFDTSQAEQLLTVIRTIETIEEIDISCGDQGFIPVNLALCEFVKVLKIFNTSKIDTDNLLQTCSGIKRLEQVSWINNSIPLPSAEMPYAIEFIDVSRPLATEDIERMMAELKPTELCIGISALTAIPSLGRHKSIEVLKIIDMPRFKDAEDVDYLHMEDEYSESINIENKERSVAITYSGSAHTLSREDIDILVKLLPDAAESAEDEFAEAADTVTRSVSRWGTLTASPAPVAAMDLMAMAPIPAVPVMADAPAMAMRRFRRDTSYLWPVDTAYFDERYNSQDYYYLARFGKKRDTVAYVFRYYDKKAKRFRIYTSKTSIAVKPGKNMVKLTTMPKEPDDSSNYIKVAFTHPNLMKSFPELYQFRNYAFCVEGFKKNRFFKKQYIFNCSYSDIRVVYTKGEASGVIELKTKSGYTAIPFDIVTDQNKRRSGFAIRSFGRQYDRYLKALNNRRNAFNEYVQKRYRRSMRITNKAIAP